MAMQDVNYQELLDNYDPSMDQEPMDDPSTRSMEARDKLDVPIPGQSFTDEPGKWAWERPARLSTVDESFEHVVDQIEKDEQSKDEMLKLMMTGIPLEQITNTIAFGGFTEGAWTVDVSELLKLPVLLHLANMAQKEQIPVKVFSDSTVKRKEEGEGMDSDTLLRLMKENNPDAFDKAEEGIQFLSELSTASELPVIDEYIKEELPSAEDTPFMEMEE